MKKALILIFASLLALSSCASYTVASGLENIAVPVYENLPPTRLAEIEALRAQETVISGSPTLPSATAITYPYVYSVGTPMTLDGERTIVDALLLPLGYETLDAETLAEIASIIDPDYEFILISGSIGNRLAFTEMLALNAVFFEDGTILSTLQLIGLTNNIATYQLTQEGKCLEMALKDFLKDIDTTLPLEELMENIQEKSDGNIAELESLLSQRACENFLLALSSSEPSSLDWAFAWPISEYLEENLDDVYAKTRKDADNGATIILPEGLEVRADFFYAQGLKGFDSETLVIPTMADRKAINIAFVV